MKNVKALSLKVMGLLSLLGLATACGDMTAPKASAKVSATKQLEDMGRLTHDHSTPSMMAGGGHDSIGGF